MVNTSLKRLESCKSSSVCGENSDVSVEDPFVDDWLVPLVVVVVGALVTATGAKVTRLMFVFLVSDVVVEEGEEEEEEDDAVDVVDEVIAVIKDNDKDEGEDEDLEFVVEFSSPLDSASAAVARRMDTSI